MVTQVAVTGREKEPDQVEAGPPSTLPTGVRAPLGPGEGSRLPCLHFARATLSQPNGPLFSPFTPKAQPRSFCSLS